MESNEACILQAPMARLVSRSSVTMRAKRSSDDVMEKCIASA